MAGFEGLVDSLGGVDITVPESFEAGNGGKSFTAGPQHMDGDTALSFVRERYAFSDGDYSRVRHQQLFLQAVSREVLTADTLTNPGRVSDMVSELSPYLTVDETLNAGEMVSIGRTMTDIRTDDLEMFTVPTDGVGRARGQSVVWPDHDAIAQIGAAMSDDDMASYFSGR
jgi:polyisoprenyl-teichoic acid--peptidoglycan teichoic acid transferase